MAQLEAGVGLSVVHVPHYIGSDEANDYYLPFPYIRYRSEKLNIDRNLIQGNLWRHGNWSLELSLGGSVKVDSEDNVARQGMSDLDFIVEAGPALHYYFSGSRTDENAILLQLPIRVATSTDFTDLSYQGITSIPRLVWRRGYFLNGYEIRPQISAGIRLGDKGYHDYIFGVDDQYVTPDRPSYEAKAGYGGLQLAYSTAVLWDQYLAAFGARYVQVGGATYEDSPLVKRSGSLMVGLALAYLF
jgi:outer membrane scaffolding protein for murein synthesis (MipA/OmpV family)